MSAIPHVEYRSPKTLSGLAKAGIGLVGLCTLFSLFIGIGQVVSPDRSLEFDGIESGSLWFLLQGLIALVQFPAFFFAAVMFLMWLFRVYKNLPALRSDNTEYSPGWAVGWWFIPFANLVKPFQVVRNAWSESDPDVDLEMGFLSSVQSGAPAYMAVWWGFWLLSNFATNITNRFWDPDNIDTVEFSGYFFIISGILWTVASVAAIKVVWEITERQELRFKNIGLLRQQEPPPPPTFDQ